MALASLVAMQFKAQKSLDFQDPPLLLPLVMDLALLKTITYAPYTVNNRYIYSITELLSFTEHGEPSHSIPLRISGAGTMRTIIKVAM